MKKLDKKKITTIIIVCAFIIVMCVCINVIRKIIREKKFTKDNIELYEANEEEVFKIEKILLCSSANAIDKSEDNSLKNLSIYQVTDMAVYISNGDELTNKNTIKQMYIDNVSFEGNNDKGHKTLNYRNILKFGLNEEKEELNDTLQDRIEFNIINTNDENSNANYDEPNFYTDCSNPITLQYLNTDIVTDYQMDENNKISFDGNILQATGITVDDINCKIKFKIHIVNNENDNYTCWINFQIPLNDIFDGTTMKSKTTIGNKYKFFKE